MSKGPIRISLKNIELLEGDDVFDGIQEIEVTYEVEGRKVVRTSRRKPAGITEGDSKITGAAKILFEAGFDYIEKHDKFFHQAHTLSMYATANGERRKVKIKDAFFGKANFGGKGTDESVIELPFEALDLFLNGKSVIPEENELTAS